MPYYNKENKRNSQFLRKNLTPAEKLLWSRLRRKQLNGIQFYRQKPILNYIVDFYAPSIKLIIEIDGGQHYEDDFKKRDEARDENLSQFNLKVLRFSNAEVLKSIDDVVSVILGEILKNPP